MRALPLTAETLDDVRDAKLATARREKRKPTFTPEQRAKAGANSKGGQRKGEAYRGAALKHYLAVPELPSDCRGKIVTQLGELAHFLEQAVIAKRKEVDVLSACRIETVLQHSAHALKVQRWIRLEHEKMTIDQKMTFSRELANACTNRDKALAALDLDAKSIDPWTAAIPVVSTPATEVRDDADSQ